MTFRTAKVNKTPEASLISAEKDEFSTLGMGIQWSIFIKGSVLTQDLGHSL